MPTSLYSYVAAQKYIELERWTAKTSALTSQWLFGVCEYGHWRCFRVDWKRRSVEWYDSLRTHWGQALDERIEKQLDVSNVARNRLVFLLISQAVHY